MELTITQNGALYCAHHKVQISKHRAALWQLRMRASKLDGQDIRGLKSGDETGSKVIETHGHRGGVQGVVSDQNVCDYRISRPSESERYYEEEQRGGMS